MTWRKGIGTLVVVAALGAGCGGGMQGDKMAMEKKSLDDRLGGKPAITAVVDDFIGNVAADTRINQRFATADILRLETMLVPGVSSDRASCPGGRAATEERIEQS